MRGNEVLIGILSYGQSWAIVNYFFSNLYSMTLLQKSDFEGNFSSFLEVLKLLP